MALGAERRATLMAYCRLDDLTDADEVLLERFYEGAVAQLADSGVSQPPEGSGRAARFDSLVDAIVLDCWENRGTRCEVTLPENRAFRQSLNQMKLTEPVFKLNTGGGA